jgi:beta-glucuronidase
MKRWLPSLGLAFALALAARAPAAEPAGASLRPPLLLTARSAAQDLSGRWTYSKDFYRTGLTDINGWVAKSRMQRFRDVDVAAEERRGGPGFFEFDLDRGPAMELPGAWNAAVPELRWYDGLIWFQRRFDAKPLPGQRSWDLYGGITRPVALIHTPATFIDDATLRLTSAGRLVGSVQLNGPQPAQQPVSLRIAALGLTLQGGTDAQGEARFDAAAPAALQRWSPEAPTLYDVDVEAGDDRLRERMGFRTIAVRGSDILLNGQPVFLKGLSLHEEEIGSNPARRIDDAAARRLLGEVKHGLHGNYVRLSHYPHSEAMLRAADELGLLVWSEIPVYWSADWDNPAVLDKARRMQAETIYRDRNRAALVLWSIGNETPVADNRTRFHTALAETVRRLDPSRLISAALLVARQGDTLHLADPLLKELDVIAVNTYAGWYGDDTLAAVARLRWEVPADKPLLFSEFGADAQAGFRDPARAAKFSEDYQAAYYRATLAMAARVPTLRGLSPWVLKDFRSPRREHPVFQNGWNRKGLISETGQRKLAFDVLAEHYRTTAP